jgi:glycogen debranching enzyme
VCALAASAPAAAEELRTPFFEPPRSGLVLRRPPRPGSFFDVVGRRAGAFGYEGRGFEAWAYPLKLVEDFRLAFRIEGYPLEFEAASLLVAVEVRPEATLFTYSHAAFTVRQILFAPIEEPGIVSLLEVRSALPMTVIGSFRPRLRLMWPAGLMTGEVAWDEKASAYTIGEETKRFAAAIAAPGAKDLAVMPHQEEPRDVPIRFAAEAPIHGAAFLPMAIAGSIEGRDRATETALRLIREARPLYDATVAHYRRVSSETLEIETPDPRVNEAFAWAKVGIDKGLASNPLLGTGFVAGFRTSGESERPGFAWFFGRDALWTTFALHSKGDLAAARHALEFLRRHQRPDGKVPHEISQSASLIPWFSDYPFPWNAADATPLYVIAQADHYQAGGDRAYLEGAWDSIVRAFRFTAGTDTDANGLVENTKFGHGWVEGGGLYPPHEEIYQQGVWVAACRALSEMARALAHAELAGEASAHAERTREAVEKTYWLADGFYAFATARPREKPPEADPGPRRETRQRRMQELDRAGVVDEDTVLPAVPLWWRILDPERAQAQIDRLGSAALATDWGQRLLSSQSRLYDPLAYHAGSVWPLFTGWAAMAAYAHGRPHVGYQALMANALLYQPSALGYVTELLSGDRNAPFSRSSHHQVWSEAMVVTPLVRGLLGIEARDGGRALRLAPLLPGDWDRVVARGVRVGSARLDVAMARRSEGLALGLRPRDGPLSTPIRLSLSPGIPLDAALRGVTVDGRAVRFESRREGDVQRIEVTTELRGPTEVLVAHAPGTEVFWPIVAPEPGDESSALRVIRARPQAGALSLVLEGRGGRSYALRVRGPRRPGEMAGVSVSRAGRDFELRVAFDGPSQNYVRRELSLPLR